MLFPDFPHLRLIADSRTCTVPHDRRFEKHGIFKKFLFGVEGQVLEVLLNVGFSVAVHKTFDPDGCHNGLQFPFAETLSGEVDEMKKYTSFLEIPLCLSGILTFNCTEDLYVHQIADPEPGSVCVEAARYKSIVKVFEIYTGDVGMEPSSSLSACCPDSRR